MESQPKFDGVQGTRSPVGLAYEDPNTKSIRSVDLILRLIAVATTLIAAAVLGSAKQTVTAPFLLTDLTAVLVDVPAKATYSSAYVYFVAANAIACAYSIFSLVVNFLGMSKPATTQGLTFVLSIVDIVMVALLASANGAAAAIGVLGAKGNSHAGWGKICNAYGRFCGQISAGIVISMAAVIVYLILVVLSAFYLNRRSR